MSFLEFAIGELKCGRLPWVHWSVWGSVLVSAVFILGSAWAGLWIGASIDEAIRVKAEICRGWMP